MELSGIKGIGNAYLKKLNTLGIFDIAGLVGFLPVKYIDFRQYTQGVDVAEGQYVFLKAEIKKLSVHGKTVKAQLLPSFWDGAAHISKLGAVWFNQPYIKDKLTVGKTYNFFAKASDFNGVLTLPNPVFEDADEPKALKGIMPIYKTKGLISQTMMRKFIKSALEYYKIGSLSEYSSVKAYTLSLNDA
ncbi:MAG: hypothetical protein LBT30_08170, partial [Clostridiales bacterium]|nr:hypothetical protein [Clostridiales bacterium]